MERAGPNEGFDEKQLDGIPSVRPARRAFDPIVGRDLSVPRLVSAEQRRRKSAIAALVDGLLAPNRKLSKSALISFPDDTPAYVCVARLRHQGGDNSENRETTREVLLEVLRRHWDPSGRAHAAYRLSADEWLHRGAKGRIKAALADRIETDPAPLVQKRARIARRRLA